MFALLVASVLGVNAGGQAAALRPAGIRWTTDKTSVMVGGCVSLVIHKASKEIRDLQLRVNGRDPVQLVDGAGPTVRQRDRTVILLWQIPGTRESYKPVSGEPDTFRIVPVFDEPGILELGLESAGYSLGTREITVKPITSEAETALDLLYPKLVRNRGAGPEAGLRMRFLVSDAFGVTSPLTPSQLDQIRNDVAVLKQHPDWAEIVEMLLRRVEMWSDLFDTQEKLHATRGRIDENTEVPPPPKAVTRCLETTVTSPFAKAIQDEIRDMVSRREQLIRSAPKRIGG